MKNFLSFFAHLWQGIKKALQKAVDDIPRDVAILASKVIVVTGLLEKALTALQSGAAIAITDIIPGEWDNALKDEIIVALKFAIPKLIQLQDCNDDIECMLKVVKEWFAVRTEAGQHADLVKLASLTTAALHANKEAEHVYDNAAQLASKAVIEH